MSQYSTGISAPAQCLLPTFNSNWPLLLHAGSAIICISTFILEFTIRITVRILGFWDTYRPRIYNECMLPVSFSQLCMISHMNVVSNYIFGLPPPPQQWPDPTTTSSCDRNTPPSPLLCPSSRSSCWLSPSAKPPPSGTTSADWHPSRSKTKVRKEKKSCGEKEERRKRSALCSCLNRPFLILFSFLLVTLL